MNSQFDTTTWLSTALMFALVGTGVLQTSRNPSRPPSVEPLANGPLYSQRISARLWEDPLEAARRAKSQPAANDDGESRRKWLAAPTAFLEQVQIDSQARKLTALALKDKWGSSLFLTRDFIKPADFVDKLRARQDPISDRLWSQFSDSTKMVLTSATCPEEVRTLALAEALDTLIKGASLYDTVTFAKVRLSPETLALKSRNPKGVNLMRLNRLLLEDAYPQEITRSRESSGPNRPPANAERKPSIDAAGQEREDTAVASAGGSREQSPIEERRNAVEALKKGLARQALLELQRKAIDSYGYQRSEVDTLFKQALATQRVAGAERPSASPREQEEQNRKLIDSLSRSIDDSKTPESKPVANDTPDRTPPRSPLLRVSASSNEVDSGSQPPATGQVLNANPTLREDRLQSVLARERLCELLAQEGSEHNWPQESEPELKKILEPPEKKTLLLPIVVPEQMYPEVRELRLRMRYAVVSALAAANFNPESADELNIVPVPICTNLGRPECGEVVLYQDLQEYEERTDLSWIPVPYEIFRRTSDGLERPASSHTPSKANVDPISLAAVDALQPSGNDRGGNSIAGGQLKSDYWQVVVLWIDERIIRKASLFRRNIDAILDALSPPELRHVRLISTQGSETLTEILGSDGALGENTKETVYFPFATVPKGWLRDRVMKRKASASPAADEEPIVRMRPIKRVQASDDYVIEMLLDELSLRLPSFGTGKGEICVVFETDSFYGRSMVDVFNRRYKEFTGEKDAKVEQIAYLKGVDGTLPLLRDQSESDPNPQDTTALLKAINKRVMEGNSGQWVLDQRQTDYLERQARYLKSTQEKIKAIGVFGTNVFDKIKVIEILRREFKNVWFFTVGLDASYISNDSPLVTRNLLIGSALDFSVQAGNIKSPEFRDSFQSAAFLSTLDALGLLGTDYKGKPGVWETSRAGFEPLKFSGHPIWHVDAMCNEQACGNGAEKGQAWSWEMFLKRHFQVADARNAARFLRPVLLILTAVVLLAVAKVIIEAWRSPSKPHWQIQIAGHFERVLPSASYKRVMAGMFVAVSAIFLFGWLAQRVLGGLSEPFHWFDGVSVWPSLIIRGFAAALGFYFFMRSFIDIDKAIQKMWNASPLLFSDADFAPISDLVKELRDSRSRISKYLWDQFSASTREALTSSPQGRKHWMNVAVRIAKAPTPEEQRSALIQSLNNILQGDSIFEASRFEGVALSPETLAMKSQNPNGKDLIRLNRMLLEDAYPREIVKAVLPRGLEATKFPRSIVEWRYYFRLLLVVASFVLLQWGLFQMLGVAGGFFTPARGSMAFFAHEMTILCSQAVFYLLVWSAVLRHLRCRELLIKLTGRTSPQSEDLPAGNPAPASLPKGALSKPEIVALLDYNQAVVQSILYPFAMLVVLLASRHPVFDAWNFPTSLLISSSLILAVLVFCAYLLNESANELAERQKVLFRPVSDAKSSSKAIWESKELIGSFIPFWKQPVIQALTLAAAGLGLQWIQ